MVLGLGLVCAVCYFAYPFAEYMDRSGTAPKALVWVGVGSYVLIFFVGAIGFLLRRVGILPKVDLSRVFGATLTGSKWDTRLGVAFVALFILVQSILEKSLSILQNDRVLRQIFDDVALRVLMGALFALFYLRARAETRKRARIAEPGPS